MSSPQRSDLNLVLIDNYDSFTYNLFQFFGELGHPPRVFRNDALDLASIREINPRGLIISPGPGTPEQDKYLGVSADVIRTLSRQIPTLGVCLGHQAMGVLYGGSVKRASALYHGKTSSISHAGTPLFQGIPGQFKVARYHSLLLDRSTLPDEIQVTARTQTGEVMAIRHRRFPMWGVQFHPESVLSQHGKKILANFLNQVKGGKQ